MEFLKPDQKTEERYKQVFPMTKFLFVTKNKYVVTEPYENWAARLANFECRPTDVWVASFPKSGTTWTQEMVWCILNDLDLEKAKSTMLMSRFPFFEWDGMLTEDMSMWEGVTFGESCSHGEQWKIMHSLPDPRPLKTHLHYEMLPSGVEVAKSKIIYVCRDPRDVCVSYFSHSQKFVGFKGTFEEFAQLFLDDLLLSCPYWKNVLDFWDRRNQDNMLFIRYEDLKQNLPSQIKIVAEFLGKEVDPSKLDEFMDHLSFEKMRHNKTVNNDHLFWFEGKTIPFMRSGKVGDWKKSFSPSLKEAFKIWTLKHLQGSDFPYYRDYD